MSDQMNQVIAIATLISWLTGKPKPTKFQWGRNTLHRFGRGETLWLVKGN
jgi:hypothetical protein